MIRSILKELLQTIFLALFLFLCLRLTIQNTQVLYPSMMPTLVENQLVIINKAAYSRIAQKSLAHIPVLNDLVHTTQAYLFGHPQRGDIIVFHSPPNPERDFIKRIVGMPGETIEIHRGKIMIDNKLFNEPYVMHTSKDSLPPTKIPPDSFFVMGDNRSRSEDSRIWGTVPLESIVGKLWLRYWPLNLFKSF